MKKLIRIAAAAALTVLCNANASAADAYGYPDFAMGADISWCTQMADQKVAMNDSTGKAVSAYELMAQYQMDAVRLRIFVNPNSSYGYAVDQGAEGMWYCGYNDLIAKGKEAKTRNQRVMLCVHFSDSWADPGKQRIPEDWAGCKTIDEIVTKAEAHVRMALEALKANGVYVAWVQLGNETRNGMMYQNTAGADQWTGATSCYVWNKTGAANFVKVFNATAKVAKEVYPGVKTVLMLDDAATTSRYTSFIDACTGLDYDLVGMSIYPIDTWSESDASIYFMTSKWQTGIDGTLATIEEVYKKYGKNSIICEVGLPNNWTKEDKTYTYTEVNPKNGKEQTKTGTYTDAQRCEKDAVECLNYFIPKLQASGHCEGIFWWEPQIYNFQNYNKGAMDDNYKPTKVWNCFANYQPKGFTLAGSVKYPSISGTMPELPDETPTVDTRERSTWMLREWEEAYDGTANVKHLFYVTDDANIFELPDYEVTQANTQLQLVGGATGKTQTWWYATPAKKETTVNDDSGTAIGIYVTTDGTTRAMTSTWVSGVVNKLVVSEAGHYKVVWDAKNKTIAFTKLADSFVWYVVGLNNWNGNVPMIQDKGNENIWRAEGVDIETMTNETWCATNQVGICKASKYDTNTIDWTHKYTATGSNLGIGNTGITLTDGGENPTWGTCSLRGRYNIELDMSTMKLTFTPVIHALYVVTETTQGEQTKQNMICRLRSDDGVTYTADNINVSGIIRIIEEELVDEEAPAAIDIAKGIGFGAGSTAAKAPRRAAALDNYERTYNMAKVGNAVAPDPMDLELSYLDAKLTFVPDHANNTGTLTLYTENTTAIEAVNAEEVNAPAEYYTLSGVKLAGRPTAAGFYIVRRGDKAEKIAVR